MAQQWAALRVNQEYSRFLGDPAEDATCHPTRIAGRDLRPSRCQADRSAAQGATGAAALFRLARLEP